MPTVVHYVVGLGSNLGDRRGHLVRGAARVAELGLILGRSAIYESPAWGGPEQGPFLNAALSLATGLEPEALLDALLEIERELGRERRVRWGPRTVDLDVLWADSLAFSSAVLRIPHERLAERTFALGPLLDVAPEARPPGGAEPYAVAFRRLRLPRLERVFEPDEWSQPGAESGVAPHHALR
jgi:2-amino-4-hydroxy-6-hydroxymethyldihydropteridine diphosphokinase